jgi:hypothetical protein
VGEWPVLEEREGWIRIRYDGVKGWLEVGQPDTGAASLAPSLGRDGADIAPEAEAAHLARGRALLGERRRAWSAGPFCVESDVRSSRLREAVTRVAVAFEAAYRERTGLLVPPSGDPESTVLLFERESTYSSFARPHSTSRAGHSTATVAALWLEARPEPDLGVLVHELTHLVNRRALGPVLPPWLEEGLAEELSWCRRDGRGNLLLGTTRREAERVRRMPRGAAPAAGAVLDFRKADFESSATQSTAYAMSGLLVRFLFEPERRERFRYFLASVAAGEPASETTLLACLGADLDGLQAAFAAWLDRR